MRSLVLIPISTVALWAAGQVVQNQSQADSTPLPSPEPQSGISASTSRVQATTASIYRAVAAPESFVLKPTASVRSQNRLPAYSAPLSDPIRSTLAATLMRLPPPVIIPDVANLPWSGIVARSLRLPATMPQAGVQSRLATRSSIALPATSSSRPSPTELTASVPVVRLEPLHPVEPLLEMTTAKGAAIAIAPAPIPQPATDSLPATATPIAVVTATALLQPAAVTVTSPSPPQLLIADAGITQPETEQIQTDVMPEGVFAPPRFSTNRLSDSHQLNSIDHPVTVASTPSLDLVPRRPNPLSATVTDAPVQMNAVAVDQTYTLGAGDRLTVSVVNAPEYSGEQQVLVDGTLSVPLIGRISVAGMTLEQASRTLESQYRQRIHNPIVTLNLLSARPLQVTIAGEVRQPGLYALNLTETASFPNIVQAIQAAGGTTQAADLRQVEVQRRGSGATQVISIDLWELVQNGNSNQNLTLRDGDTIVIPPTANVNAAETAQLAASNLTVESTQPFSIAIVGQVARPGAYSLGGTNNGQSSGVVNNQPTVTQAIQLAGGVKPLANLRQIEVRRPTRNGSEQVIALDFWRLLNAGDLSQDLILQQGDTVMIPTATAMTSAEMAELASTSISPTSIQVNVVGEVEKPGAVQVQANTTLNQAVLAAGGLNRQARRTVQLIRINPDGTLTKQQIRVDLTQGINPETNPILFNNDVVIVGETTTSRILNQLGGALNTVLRVLPLF